MGGAIPLFLYPYHFLLWACRKVFILLIKPTDNQTVELKINSNSLFQIIQERLQTHAPRTLYQYGTIFNRASF